jgi:hypothetical protein
MASRACSAPIGDSGAVTASGHHSPPRFTATRSCAPQVRISVTSGWPTLRTRARASLPAFVVVREPVADPQLHREDPLLGGFLGPRLDH